MIKGSAYIPSTLDASGISETILKNQGSYIKQDLLNNGIKKRMFSRFPNWVKASKKAVEESKQHCLP